ncbi:MAG: hypothetical protein J5794_01075 [Lachnospiraceae bacterium]|nr:hypothetical protein [Lachnospiraceae bacterium]
MKKTVIILLVFFVFCVFLFSEQTYASGTDNSGGLLVEVCDSDEIPKLSERDEADLWSFFQESLSFFGYSVDEAKYDYFKYFLPEYEASGVFPCPYSHTQYYHWSRELQIIADSYYGQDASFPYVTQSFSRYSPTQNTLKAYTVGSFNCYAYVMGDSTAPFDPGVYSGITYNINSVTVSDLALYVKADLQSSDIGMNCISITTLCPLSLSSGQSAICIRKGFDYLHNCSDYHVMKLEGSEWLHKPGTNSYAILKHNIDPSPSEIWLTEYIDSYHEWALGPVEYSGTIYFLIYQANHSLSPYYTGQNYHSGLFHFYQFADHCSLCGNDYNIHYVRVACSGPPCPVIYRDQTKDNGGRTVRAVIRE